jgi:hypothetical protein
VFFSFNTSMANHSVLFVQWAAQNEGVEIGESNACPPLILLVFVPFEGGKTEELFSRQCRPAL